MANGTAKGVGFGRRPFCRKLIRVWNELTWGDTHDVDYLDYRDRLYRRCFG